MTIYIYAHFAYMGNYCFLTFEKVYDHLLYQWNTFGGTSGHANDSVLL